MEYNKKKRRIKKKCNVYQREKGSIIECKKQKRMTAEMKRTLQCSDTRETKNLKTQKKTQQENKPRPLKKHVT